MNRVRQEFGTASTETVNQQGSPATNEAPVRNVSRRVIVSRGAQMLTAFSLLPLVGSRVARAAESCVDPSSESLRSSLNYAEPSPIADQPCAKCGFFTPEGNAGCGQCMIMSGPVSSMGHCDSWAAKGG